MTIIHIISCIFFAEGSIHVGVPQSSLGSLLGEVIKPFIQNAGEYLYIYNTCNYTLFRRFLHDLEDQRALCRIPSKARVPLSPEVF